MNFVANAKNNKREYANKMMMKKNEQKKLVDILFGDLYKWCFFARCLSASLAVVVHFYDSISCCVCATETTRRMSHSIRRKCVCYTTLT